MNQCFSTEIAIAIQDNLFIPWQSQRGRARFGPPATIKYAIVIQGHRSGSRCFAELSSVAVAPTLCLDTAPPTNQRNSQVVKAGW